ncbi:hypothetical protein HMPREF9444_01385 [Succinatimonas hippei YIT 12066]|uniref:Uncharacterized protein n=1 Tax=Succinatimonas hippei (strain DSM 22608 / JCM 16073 / KCTC 15190 / YIT 12066) TaxID=762983 RepID=E8LKY5_SUCHY|nr:hypothetical protein HMPREF9444_01385 [Succinatimonas hippei YIT 12066]
MCTIINALFCLSTKKINKFYIFIFFFINQIIKKPAFGELFHEF